MTATLLLLALLGHGTAHQEAELKRKLAEEMWQKVDKMPELGIRLEKVVLNVKQETLGLEYGVTNVSDAAVQLDEYWLGRSLLSVTYLNRGTAFTFGCPKPNMLIQYDTKYITLAPKESRRLATTLWAGRVEQSDPLDRRPIDPQEKTISCVYSVYIRFDGTKKNSEGKRQPYRISGQGTVSIENKQ